MLDVTLPGKFVEAHSRIQRELLQGIGSAQETEELFEVGFFQIIAAEKV
jgi:hypothetical protein